MLAGLVLLSCAIPSVGFAQEADTVRRDATQSSSITSPGTTTTPNRAYEKDKIYRLGKGIYTDTMRRDDFKSYASDVAELDDCDTTFQTFVLVRRQSPWRIGLFAGPNFAYCGTWENTFGATKRDNSLYNGAGFNITGNVDYFLTPATRRLRFGIGTAFGYQNYITRDTYRDYVYALAQTAGFSQSQVSFKQRASEDMFITIGPVVTFTIARSRKNPDATTFIEAGARGGLFRTEAATIAAYTPSTLNLPNLPQFVDGGGLVRSVNPSSRLYHLGALGNLAIFFPIGNNWNLGIQGQGFITKLNYLIINGIDANPQARGQLYEFRRTHGGFSGGLAVRKSFVQRKLIPKVPTVCPTCDSIPQLSIRFNDQSLKGVSLGYVDQNNMNSMNAQQTPVDTNAIAPVISWRSTTLNPRNETFTARLYYRPDSVVAGAGADQVIAQLENTTDTTLTFPSAYFSGGQMNPGFYYVTVHNRQEAKCGACMSEVVTSSFATLRSNTSNPDCQYRHRLERLEVYYRTPYTREVANVCYCNGTITSVGDTVTRLRYRGLNRQLATSTVEFDTNTVILNLKDLPGNLAQQLQAEKAKIESGSATRYKGRRVRPQVQYFRAVFTVTKLPCNGQPEQQIGSFNTTISDNTYSITGLVPLTDAQRSNLLNPAPVRKKATRRRAGNSGRRSDVMFGIE